MAARERKAWWARRVHKRRGGVPASCCDTLREHGFFVPRSACTMAHQTERLSVHEAFDALLCASCHKRAWNSDGASCCQNRNRHGVTSDLEHKARCTEQGCVLRAGRD